VCGVNVNVVRWCVCECECMCVRVVNVTCVQGPVQHLACCFRSEVRSIVREMETKKTTNVVEYFALHSSVYAVVFFLDSF